MTDAGATAWALRTTRSMSDSPPTRWRTFGRLVFIRVPLPAARMTTWVSFIACNLLQKSALMASVRPLAHVGGLGRPRPLDCRIHIACRHAVAPGQQRHGLAPARRMRGGHLEEVTQRLLVGEHGRGHIGGRGRGDDDRVLAPRVADLLDD